MSGCSLQEAFPDTAAQSGRTAAKEERKKAKRCGGPALQFLKAADAVDPNTPDPDRQQFRVAPPVPAFRRSEGFVADQQPSNKEFLPVKITATEEQERELVKSLVGQRVDDVIGQKSRTTLPRAVEAPNELPDPAKDIYGFPVASYFGKSPEDNGEGFADFSRSLNDNPGYQLAPADFVGSFAAVGLDKASGKELLATPSVNNAWKPLTPSGAQSAFFDVLPSPGGLPVKGSGGVGGFSREEKETLLKQLDTLFARLEELESKRNEYAHVEVSMFILSGLFLMFGLETVRKMR
jgi:hypothetical protein